MTISRRNLIKAGLAAGAALSTPSVLRADTEPTVTRTVRMVKGGFIQIFDPIVTTSNPTTDHAMAVYDTLFAIDSKFKPQPQMIGKWGVSDDKKTYTFELRGGLGFHDGSPVTAADCVASIRRWASVDEAGKMIMARAKDISRKNDTTFMIVLKEPLGVLVDTLAASGFFLAIMREKDANRPPSEQVTSNIGSGPFKFNEALAKPGASFAWDRNDKYVPREEPPDGFAGGKVVNVDRVIWNNIADQHTALAALQQGEIDYFDTPPTDLLPIVESDPNLALQVLDKGGWDMWLRMNCLQKPFDNVKARQALLHLIDQEAVMRAAFGNPEYFATIISIFGNGTPYSNDENTGWFKKGGNPEKAKQLFNQAGYAGEKVVILDATDWREGSNAAQFLAAELRTIGVNAELAQSDWGGVVARRQNKGSVEDGGWSIHITSDGDFGHRTPLESPLFTANGENAWFGWPKNDEYEALRAKWADVETLDERKALARKMQRLYWNFVGGVFLGVYTTPIARRKELTGLIGMPNWLPMWNMQKG
ncbi:ABC transporter substrate-binding protein [Mesorhizobium sp. M0618]|uniref:ABC transporter substrate-binding protein n=1 Tax=unclassified Mesorhizobium TaxID=325217 RepID=UPI003336C793